VITSTDIPNHGSATSHVPELVLNGFGTRLGHRIGRFLGSLFPHNAEFQGRQVVTFHNQRDYIFVRHHRYIFEEGKEDLVTPKKPVNEDEEDKNAMQDDKSDTDGEDNDEVKKKKREKTKKKTKARLQELGPRFTLKLRWIQEGTFDTQFGEYEWFHKRKEMDTTRRKFHL
jgi:ribosome production factor 1